MSRIVELSVGDRPETWAGLGFTVDDGVCEVSGVRHVLGEEAKGIRRWSLAGVSVEADAVDGIPTTVATASGPRASPDRRALPLATHPNGVVGLDHVVLGTPDLSRTIGALTGIGLELRRIRDSGTSNTPMRQAFFRLGEVILEVVGPAEGPVEGVERPARFFGLAFTVADLDATARALGDRLHPPKDAVQPGRRIATLDRNAGSTVALAFMSPDPN